LTTTELSHLSQTFLSFCKKRRRLKKLEEQSKRVNFPLVNGGMSTTSADDRTGIKRSLKNEQRNKESKLHRLRTYKLL